MARTFIKTRARELERALYDYDFEQGSPEAVINEIKTYQNEDGGFGRGLEPDFWCKESSALATSIALRHLAEVGASVTEEAVKNAIVYLLKTFDHEKMRWQIVPKQVETEPRAVWWNYSEDWAWGNPTAEILGLLHHFKELVPKDFLKELTEYAIRSINSLSEYEQHEFLCFIKLEKYLPLDDQLSIQEKLRRMAVESVTTNPEKWEGYCLLPLDVAFSPSSKFFDLFAEEIPINLDFIIKKQADVGFWDPTWTWGQYESEWKKAKEQWRGILTLDYLKVLRAYDAIN
ncbi:hypothetical protein [Planococcus sp. YIM B11945]|uniref:hypothetical protein n=1 Tax=Planococcus sp. YIM B11945 TaxID=3435410 RepID=UPI003D7E67B2